MTALLEYLNPDCSIRVSPIIDAQAWVWVLAMPIKPTETLQNCSQPCIELAS